MKKFLTFLLSISLAITSFSIPVFATPDINVEIDGKTISFDVPPQTINGRTMIPMRIIFESLGANVSYVSASHSDNGKAFIYAEKPSSQISVGMYINDPKLYLKSPATDNNEVVIELDSAPTVIDGRTLVPVRAVAKAFDCSVTWNNAEKTVSIVTIPNTPTLNNQANTSNLVPAKSVSLDTNKLSMVSNETYLLTATVEPFYSTNKAVTWNSSNQKVATVSDNGIVTAISPGRATITAKTANNKTASCNIEVKNVTVLSENTEYGPMKVNYVYTTYNDFLKTLYSNHIKSFVFTNIESSYDSYKLTACIQGKVTDCDYVNVDVYFYNSMDQCIGTTTFYASVQENVDYNISDYTYVDKNIIDNTQYIKFFSASGNEAKKLS